MFNPFPKLRKAFLDWARGSYTVSPSIMFECPIPQPRNRFTPFEQTIFDRFEDMRGNAGYSALCVSIITREHSDNVFKNLVTGAWQDGGHFIDFWKAGYDLRREMQIKYVSSHMPVMLFDLHGPALQDQMPADWRPGSIVFPDKYLRSPHINAPNHSDVETAFKINAINVSQAQALRVKPMKSRPEAINLPDSFEQVTVCINERGKKRDVPQNIIRGVCTNENPRLSAPRMKAPQ